MRLPHSLQRKPRQRASSLTIGSSYRKVPWQLTIGGPTSKSATAAACVVKIFSPCRRRDEYGQDDGRRSGREPFPSRAGHTPALGVYAHRLSRLGFCPNICRTHSRRTGEAARRAGVSPRVRTARAANGERIRRGRAADLSGMSRLLRESRSRGAAAGPVRGCSLLNCTCCGLA
jgi:hypothetical protein